MKSEDIGLSKLITTIRSQDTNDDFEVTLTKLLEFYDVPIENWGKKSAKTTADLVREIKNGETNLKLYYHKDFKQWFIKREIEGVGIGIFYSESKGERYQLVEAVQVFLDGNERPNLTLSSLDQLPQFVDYLTQNGFRFRQRHLQEAVSGKVRSGSTLKNNAYRELSEELGLKNPSGKLKKRSKELVIYPSLSYPGLQTHLNIQLYYYEMPESEFRQEGYVEVEDNLVNYFVWRIITPDVDYSSDVPRTIDSERSAR